MSKVIPKLNKLKNPKSFLQVNTVKGFKYVDRAGEIVNAYHKENIAPLFSMDLNGLTIVKPIESIEQLKITPEIFWMKSGKVDSLDMISNIFCREAEKILKMLDIQEVSRIGWRNHFIYEFANKEDQEKYFKKFTIIENSTLSLIRLEIKTNRDFNANLVLQPVIKDENKETFGVLFDLDLYINKEVELIQISKTLNEFKHYMSTEIEDGFLKILNGTF